jgi:hypothetical protein
MRSRKHFLPHACVTATACLSLFAAVAAAQVPPAERVFSGQLGDKYRIQMQLRREGRRLSGTYFYERVRQNLELRGEIDGQDNFTLREYDARGALTGVFKGKWQPSDCEGCADYLSGNWSRPDGTRVMPFSLTPYAVAFRGPLKLMTRALSEKNRKGQPEYEITIEYPQLEEAGGANVLRFNEIIRGKAMKALAYYRKDSLENEGEFDLSYEVGLANDDLVSVNLISYSHYGGAGSHTIVSETVNYDLQQGRLIKLDELFLSGSDYEKFLREYALRDLKKQYQADAPGVDEQVRLQVEGVVGAESTWTITREGLGLVFDWPNARPTSVIVPYHALAKVIRSGGPLAKLAARGPHNK